MRSDCVPLPAPGPPKMNITLCAWLSVRDEVSRYDNPPKLSGGGSDPVIDRAMRAVSSISSVSLLSSFEDDCTAVTDDDDASAVAPSGATKHVEHIRRLIKGVLLLTPLPRKRIVDDVGDLFGWKVRLDRPNCFAKLNPRATPNNDDVVVEATIAMDAAGRRSFMALKQRGI